MPDITNTKRDDDMRLWSLTTGCMSSTWGLQDAERLQVLTRDIHCIVNLIMFNPHSGTEFQRSDPENVRRFQEVFTKAGRPCSIRASRGGEEMAACGQLGDIHQRAKLKEAREAKAAAASARGNDAEWNMPPAVQLH